MTFQPRPKQAEVLAYAGGKMGVSAVPGSGKTQTLCALAAGLVARGGLAADQEVLIVTLVNSAVDNFARRVAELVEEMDLLPHVGYRVRTLHGLAHDIVRERPALVNLANDFQIVDERETQFILHEAADAWVSANPYAADAYLAADLDDRKRDWVRREHWPRLVGDIGSGFIRQAKDLRTTPPQLRENLDALPEPLPLLEMGWAIYESYQRALTYRGAVDYDDLIRLALLVLRSDGDYLARLRYRWPYILEDEAQDSSALQERILRLLAGDHRTDERAPGNWVRVGDPNQAIYETFTTASPRFLRAFLVEQGVLRKELPNSGRSTQSIMDLANTLVDWTRDQHPVSALRDALTLPPIEPTPPGDPQPNPPDDPAGVQLVDLRLTADGELAFVTDSLTGWLPEHPESTVAVLVPRNDRGEHLVGLLRGRGVEVVELLRSTGATRATAGALGNVLAWLAEPDSPARLEKAYRVWRRADREDADANARVELAARTLKRCRRVEEYVWPRFDSESLACLELPEMDAGIEEQLRQFRELAQRWQAAAILPVDQLILTVAQDLFDRPAELALTHKLAGLLAQANEAHPQWRLPELTQELAVIARNERKFLGLSEDDTGFDPDAHRGKVVVATIHKAKGLEWDRVYLMSANNYDFPSAMPGDTFISERWFVRDGLNLEAETLAQLRGVFSEDIMAPYAAPGQASAQARTDYAAERLRLLYVGITRAKRELIITWNTGRHPGGDLRPAVAFQALRTWWEEQRHAAGSSPSPAANTPAVETGRLT
jgi:DNA helicase-2/ATP-dependent DNA helicase PcrA